MLRMIQQQKNFLSRKVVTAKQKLGEFLGKKFKDLIVAVK